MRLEIHFLYPQLVIARSPGLSEKWQVEPLTHGRGSGISLPTPTLVQSEIPNLWNGSNLF